MDLYKVTAENITYLLAFVGGILSFLSPCVLPLVPGYISFISGASLQDLKDKHAAKKLRKDVILNALFFILGFTIVVLLFGIALSLTIHALAQVKRTLAIIAGVIIVIFGIHTTGLIRIPFLYYEKRVHLKENNVGGWSAIVIGISFAFGWTPCLGPIISAVTAVAAAQQTLVKGIIMLLLYSLGLAVPFLLTAWSVTLFAGFFEKVKKYMNVIEWVTGILLIIVGLLFIFDGMKFLNQLFMPLTGALG